MKSALSLFSSHGHSPILEVPDPRLRQISSPVEAVTDNTRALIADMFETMYAAPGHRPRRGPGRRADPPCWSSTCRSPRSRAASRSAIRVFVNPEILDPFRPGRALYRRLLSVPEQSRRSRPPRPIRARWLDEQGEAHEEEIEGILAVVLQHEMDHLQGVLFIDHLSRLKREMILRKIAKLRKAAA